MKMLKSLILLALAFGAVWAADEAADPIDQAISVLQKSLDGGKLKDSDKTRVLSGIESLKKLVASKPMDMLSGFAVTEKDLKKVISVPFTLKDDYVTVLYDWSNPKSFKDWKIDGDPMSLDKGCVKLSPLSTATNIIKFSDKISIKGSVALVNREGDHLSYGSIIFTCNNYNAWNINIIQNGKNLCKEKFSGDYVTTGDPKTFIPYEVNIGQKGTKLKWGDVSVAGATELISGNLVLLGGKGGDKHKNLLISGEIDQSWLKSELEMIELKKKDK